MKKIILILICFNLIGCVKNIPTETAREFDFLPYIASIPTDIIPFEHKDTIMDLIDTKRDYKLYPEPRNITMYDLPRRRPNKLIRLFF